MTRARIEQNVVISAPRWVVWRALSEPNHIVRWFSDQAELDLRPGGEGVLTFSDKATNEPATLRIRFEAVDAPRRFAYRWLYREGEDPVGGNSLLVEFKLAEEGDKTRLTVAESGIDLMSWADAEKEGYAESHAKGWVQHLDRLAIYAAGARDRSVV